jgi:sodium-dependent dicarboxylate transporter 2/3/5
MPQPVTDFEARLEHGLKTAGLVGGPLLAGLVYLWNPGSHPPEARRLLVLALAITWWITEAIPLPATSLVAAALAIVTGVAPARQVLAPFADPVIFLFLGSFLLAEALSRFGLDVRLAAWLLGLPLFARTAAGRMAAFGTASAAIRRCCRTPRPPRSRRRSLGARRAQGAADQGGVGSAADDAYGASVGGI